MLLQEGTSKGNEPSVKVLEIAQHQDRKADDLLPYLGNFAKFFRTLPKRPEDLILRTAYVPLNDIECFTKTIIDVPDTVQNVNRKKGRLFSIITRHILMLPKTLCSWPRTSFYLCASPGTTKTGTSTTTPVSIVSSSVNCKMLENS